MTGAKVANSSSLDSLVMADEVMLPEQVFVYSPPAIGSVRLLAAILGEAIVDLRGNDDARDRAMRWFASDLFRWGSFLFVCQMLGLEPSVWRTAVQGMTARPGAVPRLRRGAWRGRLIVEARTRTAE